MVFQETDPWVHMRLVDALLAQFPRSLSFDAYRLFPGGQPVAEAPLLDYLVATTAWLAGAGSPSPHTVDVVGAAMPAVLGLLVVAAVFFLGRALFGRMEAVLAALLAAVLPGQLLQRSVLGYTDHHVAEALFSTLALLFLACSLRGIRPAATSAAAGLALGAYLLSWPRGFVVVAILTLAGCAQIALDHARRRSSRELRDRLLVALGVALACVAPAALAMPLLRRHLPFLLGAIALLAGYQRLAAALSRRGLGAAPLLVAAALLLVGAAAALLAASPALLEDLRRLGTSDLRGTVAEARPLLLFQGRFSLLPLWRELTTSSVLALAGLVVAAREAWRRHDPALTLLSVWSVVMLSLFVAQARFGYYAAVCAALLTALLLGRLVWERFSRGFAAAVILAIAVYPNLQLAPAAAREFTGPNDEWLEALDWMRTSTPEPFGDPAAYERRFAPGDPELARGYGVMCWWDHGYWITRIAHRVPCTNPTQARAQAAARFFVEEDEAAAAALLAERGARYVVVDDRISMAALPTGQLVGTFDAMALWAGVPRQTYFQQYQVPTSEGPRPIVLFTPAYYRTMAVRLAALQGAPVEPHDATWVAAFEQPDGGPKRLTSLRPYATYQAALDATRGADPRRTRIVGRDPLRPPVPLPPLARFTLAHRSPRGQVLVYACPR